MKLFRILVLSLSVVLLITFSGLLLAGKDGRRSLYRALGNLAEVIHLVHENYVDPVDLDRLEKGFESGMLESLDPACALLSEDEPSGLDDVPPFGIVLSRRLGSAAVRQVLPGSPAEAAGLQKWEIVERIGDDKTRDLPLWEIRARLRAAEKAGKPLQLSVMDQEVENRRSVELTPKEWTLKAVSVRQEKGVAVMTVSALPKGAAVQLAALLRQHSHEPIVLDLRPLVWGVEDEAIAVADLFAKDGELGRWKGQRAGEKTFTADAASVASPPVTVVDHGTWGVGEVLTAALSREGASLVGEETAGHALHLQVVRQQGMRLVLPVGVWLRADGKPLDGSGIEPGEKVEGSDEGDPPLERAIELAVTSYGRAAA